MQQRLREKEEERINQFKELQETLR